MRRPNKAPVDNLSLEELKAVYQELDSKRQGECTELRATLRRRRQSLTRDLWALVLQKMEYPENPVIECDNISSYSNLNGLLKAFQINVRISAGPHKDSENTPVSFYVWWTSRPEAVQQHAGDAPLPSEQPVTRSPAAASVQLADNAKQFLDSSRNAYRSGRFREALQLTTAAREASSWPDPQVAAHLLRVLLEFPRDGIIENILTDVQNGGLATDEIMLLKARWHFERGSLEEAKSALDAVSAAGTRGLLYQTALYNMAMYARGDHMLRYLYLAHGQFLAEINSFPDSYWARVCLTIPCRLLRCPEHNSCTRCCDQLDEQIAKYPENSVPRFFRLLHTMVVGSQRNVINLVNRDRRVCKPSMEVSADLLNVSERALRLLCTEQQVAFLREQLRRWMASFTLLL